MAYYLIEPFGEKVEWFRTGSICAVVANANRSKGRKPFKPADFMPDDNFFIKSKVKKQTVKEMKNILENIFSIAKVRGLTKEG
jgi:hypothetical protein